MKKTTKKASKPAKKTTKTTKKATAKKPVKKQGKKTPTVKVASHTERVLENVVVVAPPADKPLPKMPEKVAPKAGMTDAGSIVIVPPVDQPN